MNKQRIKVLKPVLSDASANFHGGEEFIKKRLKEVCSKGENIGRRGNFLV